MIKKLQRKFVLIATFSLLAVMVLVIGTINVINLVQTNRNVDNILHLLSENDGKFPAMFRHRDDGENLPDEITPPDGEMPQEGSPPSMEEPRGGRQEFSPGITEETPFKTRYFIVRTDEDGQITQVDTGHIAAVSSEDAQSYASGVLAKKKNTGYTGIYKYLIRDTDSGSVIVFVDCSTELSTALSFLVISVTISLISVLVVFILVFVFSRRAVKPVIESVEKQKQFITDAGHELKTPIAIISANTDVLELTSGKNEWTESIRNQTKRLGGLVKDMLTLSRMDEESYTLKWQTFSVSQAVEEAASPFETPAKNEGKTFVTDIAPDLSFNGDESQIRQLVTILCDNALKYSSENSLIRLTLASKGKNILFTVQNTCAVFPEGDLNRLFDRFYRGESSRSRETGGCGIGLSIARAIVQAHKGKISAVREENNVICFRVVL